LEAPAGRSTGGAPDLR
jgi:hypothetical protein